jgi:tryptophan synthase alpha chain
MTPLLEHLRARAAGGRKLLVPYLMGGIPDRLSWPGAAAAVAAHADLVEIGLPYSDPLMDGPVIAAAGERVIRSGVGPLDVLDLSAELPAVPPRVVMTYYNPIHRCGEVAFCARAAAAGFSGLIVPDIPLEESESLRAAAAHEGIAWIPLVAPTSPSERVAAIVATCTGFVYAVSTLGVTGARESLSERAAAVVGACKQHTDLPVLVGIGVSTPEHARIAVQVADGVVIGSAVVQRVLEEGSEAAAAFLSEVREALDD